MRTDQAVGVLAKARSLIKLHPKWRYHRNDQQTTGRFGRAQDCQIIHDRTGDSLGRSEREPAIM